MYQELGVVPVTRSASPPYARWVLLVVLAIVAVTVSIGWLAIVKTEGRETLAAAKQTRTSQATELKELLTRSGYAIAGVEVEAILTTPTFFEATRRPKEAAEMRADRALVFVANENVHYGELSPKFSPILRIDGATMRLPTEVRALTDAVHHRTNVVIFDDVTVRMLDEPHVFELLLPSTTATRTALRWDTPIDYPADVMDPRPLSIGLLLSLAAGLLAAISPCLLQLTAFYLPTLAGVQVDANGDRDSLSASDQRRVVRTAGLFVLGFTIPYTIGGALMGALGQAVAASGLLTPTGPIAVGAGVVMMAMAAVVAHRSRAPLVCKIPMPASVRDSGRVPFLAPFVSGFAIATGCLACFGGAILGVLLVYSGLLGSALLGGLAMFVFSLGIAIPFMLAALSLSRVLPVAVRLHRASPAIGLVSGITMFFFGATMATGNFHVVSGWLYQRLPLA